MGKDSSCSFCCCFWSTFSFIVVAVGVTLLCLWQFVGFETPGTNYDIKLSNGDGLLDPLAYTKGLPIAVDVEVSNPNSYALEADKIQAELLVPDAQNMQIAVVKHPEKVRIPKYESVSFDMKGSVKYSAEVAALLARSCSKSTENVVAVNTIVSFSVWGIFPLTLPEYTSNFDCGDLIDSVGGKIREAADNVSVQKKQVINYNEIHFPGQKLPVPATGRQETKSPSLEDANANLRKRT